MANCFSLLSNAHSAGQVEEDSLNLQVRGAPIEVVHKFKYLGSIFTSDGTLDAEISHSLSLASAAWHQLKSSKVWSSRHLTLARKVLIFKTIVLPILLCL